MIRRPATWLAVALLGGCLLAGCGSSSKSTSTSTPTATTTGSAPAGTTTSTGSTATSPAGAATAQAIEACKHQVQSSTALPPNSKAKLEAVCSQAANGNTPAVKQAVREVCEEAINKSQLPSFAKSKALATCRSRTK
jgi:hypothetical protein